MSVNFNAGGGGSATVAGTIDMQGGTVSYSGGPLGLTGTLKNGTLSNPGGAALNSSSGTLDNITLSGTTATTGVLQGQQHTHARDGVTLNIGSGQLRLTTAPGALASLGNSTVQMSSGLLYVAGGGTGTIGVGVTVQGTGTIKLVLCRGQPRDRQQRHDRRERGRGR